MADPKTRLHYAANMNFDNGVYVPGAVGFNLADVTPGDVNLLPGGTQGLVWLGDSISGATASFQATVDSLAGNPNVYGFDLADEPGPGNAANLKAEADYIHAHDPGAKTFIVLLNNGSDSNPQFSYNSANTNIDLFGLDPYPVQGGVNYSAINAYVTAAEAQGIQQDQIVPVYQAFGGVTPYITPTVAQEQIILSTWGALVPAPAFDFAYSWGTQDGDTAIATDPTLQQVFAAHNGSSSGFSGSPAGNAQPNSGTDNTPNLTDNTPILTDNTPILANNTSILANSAPGAATAIANSVATVAGASADPPATPTGVPSYSHVVVVMEENHSFNEIIGNSTAPYINGTLAAGGALLTNYSALTHPSEPNYFGIYAGSTFGISDDNHYSEPDPTLATVLQAAGKTFTGYVESNGSSYDHNPWESFPEGFSVEKDFSSFPSSGNFASLPTVSFVTPGVNDDMHNGTIAQGDTWLQNNINAYAQWAKSNNSLLVVVWDEDDGTQNNQVPAILYGAGITPGTYATAYNHYDTLATIAAAAGVTAPNNAATAAPITGMFGATTPPLSGSVVLTAATEGTALPGSTKVATFTDTNTADTAAGFTASITWGDGTTSAGTISGSNGSFTVTAGHTYADEGNFALSTTITRTADKSTVTPTGAVTAAEADALTPHAASISGTAGQALDNVTVATFSDSDTASPASDFTASIAWGDGTTSAGTVSGGSGTFTVSGSHTYAAAGTDAVAVTLTDDAPGSAEATANSTAQIGSGGGGGGGGLTISSATTGPLAFSSSDSPLTITSSGKVTSTGTNVDAIDGPGGGPSVVVNAGTVSAAGSSGAGVYLQAGGTVTNSSGATLSGDYGVYMDGPGIVLNAGTISGRTEAVQFSNTGANRLVVDPSAVFSGAVDGGSAASTLELAGGTGSISGLSGGSGTISQNGSWSFSNFNTLVVDTGGTWALNGGALATVTNNGTIGVQGSLDVSSAVDPGSSGLFQLTSGSKLEVAAALGSNTRIAFLNSAELIVDDPLAFGSQVGSASYTGPQLQGFGSGSEINIRQFSSAGATAVYDTSTGLLQISNSANQRATLEFQAGSLSSGTFHTASDGGAGILITLS